ncbi:nucleotidyl transferase domain-containing protein [Angomonas deanei]|uniref:Cytidylyltransferase-like, putative n=1 Tax=Angomonas deanei TaxID=59799 RepID=A0A7G2C699_9TRYP|nr:nucleotidyl transferase domain-containing protein [Angomonas deanei]CAD2215266.1 Cytidylyltransferase-like, putative [Angomonas deanei]|eukprot:EPY25759.1 nucleotidyl transferase domain-containing protein [Angomonas deanei]
MFIDKYKPLISAFHSMPGLLSIKVCGSGTGLIQLLSTVPGCSNTLIHGETLYNAFATEKVLDYVPKHFVSAAISRQLAQRAYRESVSCLNRGQTGAAQEERNAYLVGIGITSALTTSRERMGVSQVFLSAWTKKKGMEGVVVHDYHVVLPKEWEREKQEIEVLLFSLHCVADIFATMNCDRDLQKLSQFVPEVNRQKEFVLPSLYCPVESSVTVFTHDSEFPIPLVLHGKVPAILWNSKGDVRIPYDPYHPEKESDDVERVNLLYPGSFNPLHYGHTELARAATKVAEERLGKPARVTYEMAVRVVDKGAIDVDQLKVRLGQFIQRGGRAAITSATLFVEKSAVFPGYGFIIGMDTAKRVLDPKYYGGGTQEEMLAALLEIKKNKNFFIVAGRKLSASATADGEREKGTWEDLSSLTIPTELRDMFISIPESDFRIDVSSTEIRERQGQKNNDVCNYYYYIRELFFLLYSVLLLILLTKSVWIFFFFFFFTP